MPLSEDDSEYKPSGPSDLSDSSGSSDLESDGDSENEGEPLATLFGVACLLRPAYRLVWLAVLCKAFPCSSFPAGSDVQALQGIWPTVCTCTHSPLWLQLGHLSMLLDDFVHRKSYFGSTQDFESLVAQAYGMTEEEAVLANLPTSTRAAAR